MDVEGDMYCSTPESESDTGDQQYAELRVTLQPAQNGFIVNGSCYLSWQQWNTLVTPSVSSNLLYCVSCGRYMEASAGREHTRAREHCLALEAAPPLDKFELSIVRRINDQYHCAVCNESFSLSAESEHFGGKMHAGNQLFAINKTSDILDNSFEMNNNGERNKVDTYHFKTHAMKSPTHGGYTREYNDNLSYINFQHNYYFDDDNIECEEEQPVFTGLSYATMAKKPKVKTPSTIVVDLGSKQVTVNFDSWNMLINLSKSKDEHDPENPRRNMVYCMACKIYFQMRSKREHCSVPEHMQALNKCRVVESYEDYFIRQVDDKLYHCGHCNNLQLIHEMEDHIEDVHPRKKHATDGKNFRNSPAKNVNAQTDNNGATKPIDANVKDSDSPMKNSYSLTKNTVNVDKNTVNDMEKADSIMKNKEFAKKNLDSIMKNAECYTKNTANVDNKVNTTTVNKNKLKDSSNVTLTTFTQNVQSSPVKTINNTRQDVTTQNGPNKGLTRKLPGIFDPIEIYPFGDKITVLSIAFNVCCQRPGDFYCGLCDMVCVENFIDQHIYEVRHVEVRERTPFITHFNNNLIRAIREALHCAICNVPIAASSIYIHLQDPQHIDARNRALSQPKLPPIGVKIPNVPEILPTSGKTPNSLGATPNISPNAVSQGIHARNAYNGTDTAVNVGATHNISPNALNQGDKVYNNANNGTHSGLLTPVSVETVNINTDTGMLKGPSIFYARPASNNSGTHSGLHTPINFVPISNLNQVNNGKPTSNRSQSGFNTPIFNNNAQTVFNNGSSHINVSVKQNAIGKSDASIGIGAARYNEDLISLNDDKEECYEEIDSEEENINKTFDSIASEDAVFDLEEHVYLKLKNSYMKIANTSYNTLVHIGDGSRHCFVCSISVPFTELQKHVDSRSHLENMEKYMFLDKYEDHLLRQIYLMYHCAICNVIVSRKELKIHLEWPTHALQNITLKNVKKTRKTEIKGGVKQIVVSTQKENIYLHENEPKIKISVNVQVTDKMVPKVEKKHEVTCDDGFSRKNKIIIFNDNVLKVSWESWHSITVTKSGVKCAVCQRALAAGEEPEHCASEWHRYGLDKPFEKQYAPALIRKINDTTLNCLFCNTEVSNKENLVQIHITGKKHTRNFEEILKDSSQANTYTDCHDDVLML